MNRTCKYTDIDKAIIPAIYLTLHVMNNVYSTLRAFNMTELNAVNEFNANM